MLVRSAHGELTGIAKVDRVHPGRRVSVPHGHQGANVNRLTNKDDIDQPTGMALYSGVPVTLHDTADARRTGPFVGPHPGPGRH